ncbi:hypothetical protein ACKI1I_14100 [Streptomyces turgidiscabies]|uniref:hypothetical protein n=1 Tax=Streptomyces TaxID=1883 RepID=UPI00076F01C7|nr:MULTISPECIES: hypothetical protein [Streptomyces]MDX3493009.1 hypothetical protein [Streptomyces turgidiscabies]GAQ74382.1 hypothetical protein T45_06157 [Streptomyces turgidiscabies]
MNNYKQISRLAAYHLEESYVLEIEARPGSLAFELDLALSTDHPLHGPASPGERHCYRRGRLEFSPLADLHWTDQGTPPAKDATGELDYGSIDSLEVNGNLYTITGDFGHISVTALDLSIRLRSHRAPTGGPVNATNRK